MAVKMLVVNHAIALKKMKKEKEAIEKLNSVDWSASSPMFNICVEAVRENVDRVSELMPILALSQDITAKEFRNWPAFDWIRDHENIVRKFEEVYKEPLKNVKKTQVIQKMGEDL